MATNGTAPARFYIGVMYEDRRGFRRIVKRPCGGTALQPSKDSRAQFSLCHMYALDHGVPHPMALVRASEVPSWRGIAAKATLREPTGYQMYS
jgi:hypothetical protein